MENREVQVRRSRYALVAAVDSTLAVLGTTAACCTALRAGRPGFRGLDLAASMSTLYILVNLGHSAPLAVLAPKETRAPKSHSPTMEILSDDEDAPLAAAPASPVVPAPEAVSMCDTSAHPTPGSIVGFVSSPEPF
eukprot:s588_g13.t1